jgi:hypothetical protein
LFANPLYTKIQHCTQAGKALKVILKIGKQAAGIY